MLLQPIQWPEHCVSPAFQAHYFLRRSQLGLRTHQVTPAAMAGVPYSCSGPDSAPCCNRTAASLIPFLRLVDFSVAPRASSPYTTEDTLDAIQVAYGPLPPVVDVLH